jgi:hypothetical protein
MVILVDHKPGIPCVESRGFHSRERLIKDEKNSTSQVSDEVRDYDLSKQARIYPNRQGATFNLDYYLNQHIRWARKLTGDKGTEIRKGFLHLRVVQSLGIIDRGSAIPSIVKPG